MRWRLIPEEFRSELIYILAYTYIVADALSRLDKIDYPNKNSNNAFVLY